MKPRKVLLASALLCLGVVCAGLLARRPTAPPSIQLLSPDRLPHPRVPLSRRFIPSGRRWAWAWRLREKLLGPFKPVTIEVSALGPFTGTSPWTFVPREPDVVAPDGLQVWHLNAAELDDLRRQLKRDPDANVSFRALLGTADGTEATMMCGGSTSFIQGARAQAGLRVDARPRIRGQVTDLIASLLWCEAVTNRLGTEVQSTPAPVVSLRTNLSVSGRFQLTDTCGIFFLHPAARPGEGRFGALITAKQGPPPGQRLQQAIRKL